MKIVEVIPQLSSGGGERFTVDLCNELSLLGHNVTLIVFFPFEGENGFYVRELSSSVKVMSLDKKKGLNLVLLLRLWKIIKKLKPDIVHSHLRAIQYLFFSTLVTRKVRFFHTIHNSAEKEVENNVTKIIRKFLFSRGRITPVTISQESDRSFREFYNLKTVRIDNGRNIAPELCVSKSVKKEIQQYRYSPHTRVIIQLARFSNVKRQDFMARVAKRLEEEGYDFTILMIGRKDVDILAKVNAVHCPRVHVLGERTNSTEYLKEAGTFGLSSSYEGLPISLIEALGVGAIPICTPAGGIMSVIKNGQNGILSDDITEESYYRAMKRYFDMNESEIEYMRTQVLCSYEPFSMNRCAKKYEKLFS